MAKKKKRKNVNHDILGIIFIAVGIMMLFSICTYNAGIFGKVIKKVLIFMLGIGAFIFPIIIIFLGFCLIKTRGKLTIHGKFYGIILFFVNSLLLIQLIYMKNNYNGDFYESITALANSDTVFHGGILSFLIDLPLFKLLGDIGCYIIFTAIYLITTIIIFNFSIMDLINNSKKIIKKEEKKNKPVINNDKKVNEGSQEEKGKYIENLNKKIKIIDFMKKTNLEEETSKVSEGNIKNSINQENKRNENKFNEEINKELSEKLTQVSNEMTFQYECPTIDLLNINNTINMNKDDKRELLSSAAKLEETLNSFGVEAKVLQVTKGPSVIRYELQPSSGVKVSKIVNLSDDIALSLAARGVRIEAPIPGKSAVGIEVPNKELKPVYLREVIESDEFKNSKRNISFALGKDIAGNCVVADLAKMPHLLIAGATGSGKSVCINTLIISLLYKYSPENVRLLMIDPKVVELSIYNGIPHLLIPVVTEPKKAAAALNWAVNEMTRRYKLFADNSVRNVEGYNELLQKGIVTEKLPWIVIIVDELADLMMVCPGDVEDYIGRLAQMARAAGMHLVIATQRPSVDVITGVIKANIPSRISFAVSSQIDSRTILDTTGAEKLLGKGDMLFYPLGESKPIRIQGAFITEEEVEKVVEYIKKQKNNNDYKEEILNHINSDVDYDNEYDDLLDEATRIVVEANQASTSLIQRRLRIGYNRAARIIEQLEIKGIISSRDGSKPRQILVEKENYLNNN